MTVLQIYTVLAVISGILALDSCSDTSSNCQYCGTTNYPREVPYRHNCMKTCGVCSNINVALDKPTKQSSTLYYGEVNSSSSNAVDGNTNSNWFRGHCTHTDRNTFHWWCVDLKQIYNIGNIKVLNRNQYKGRLAGFEIKTSFSNQCDGSGFNSATSCYIDTSQTNQDVYTINACNQGSYRAISARTVYIGVTTEFLTLCEVQIFSAQCNTGYYSTSSSTCQPCNRCLDNRCDPTTGVCTDGCTDTYYGDTCTSPCSYKCSNSRCYTTSLPSTPQCTDGCIGGYTGPYCQSTCPVNCRSCQKNGPSCTDCALGWYGTICHQKCSDGCVTTMCNKLDGVCRCKATYYGSKCTLSCSDNCTNSRCYTTSSSLLPQCTAGCVDGYQGSYCQSSCPDNCRSCQRYRSSCNECTQGWYGADCESRCPDNCTGGCGKIYGTCHDCKPGTVGQYCNLTCGTECQKRTDQPAITCDKDGRCADCIVGKYGDRCNMNCSTRCDGGCERYTGKCATCIKGKSGDRCSTNCNDNCTVCNQKSINSCTECKDGKWGQSCNKQCNINCTSIVGTTVSKCNITNGLCSGGCKIGIYGTECNKDCSYNCKGSSCHQTTGDCTNGCLPGKIGSNCTADCEAGKYGENCKGECGNCAQNTSCGISDGSCGLIGCADGFQGPTCHLKKKVPVDNTATIMGSVVAAVVVVVIVVVVTILFVRYRRRQKSVESNQFEVNNSPPDSSVSNSDSTSKNTALTVTEKSKVNGNTYANLLAEDENEGAQVYVNVEGPTGASTRIKLKNLLQYTKQRKTKEDSLKAEFETLPSGLCSAYDYCMNTVNKPKNRYKNICAFDHSRVKLDIENDDPNSDYINACYITGYGDIPNKYIASQGPVDVIIKEFLRLLWVSETGKIVMLTNLLEMGHKKCFKYWPNSGKQMKFGNISMALMNEDTFSHFTVRTFKITKDECGSRTIKQYHYTSWPDKGVPTDIASLVEFRNKVTRATSPHPGPMVVHCSAGIGRTGTFIALDYSIEKAKAEGSVDIFECVKQLRYDRVNMVQTWEQYAFLHDALAEWYVAGDITFPVTSYQQDYQTLLKVSGSSGKSQLQERFEMLDSISPSPTTADFSVALSEENKDKNRHLSVLASDTMRLCLSKPQMTDYINALGLSSYKKKRAYILTQTPLPNTVIDFWTMVVEQDVTTIVNMDITETANDIGQYIPTTDDLNCGPFNISKIDETEHENGIYTVVTCLINSELDESLQRCIRIYQCNFWDPMKGVPQSAGPIFTILEDIKSCSEQDEGGPIIVHCLNGVEKSGVFCVLAAILERLTIEQDVSILQTLVQLRVSRPQIMASYEQLKFCFDAVGEYLDEFSVYANSC